MVQRAVAEAGGTLPDFSKQEPDQWMESCVHVDPVVYARLAEETLRQAGVELFLETEVLAVEKTKKGWRVGPVEGRQVVDTTGSATVAALAGANSALRVQASCLGMGQAAGVTAALAARRHCDPRDVPLDMIKKQLTGIGHLVPQQDHRTSQTIHRENRPVHRLKS